MNNNKIPKSTYLLAIPPLAQWFLVWYAWQAIKVVKEHGWKHFAQAVYTQMAFVSDKDATELNKAVEKYHQDEAKESVKNLQRFENVAVLSLIFTGIAFFTLPADSKLSVVVPVKLAMEIPKAAESTIRHHFTIPQNPQKGDYSYGR